MFSFSPPSKYIASICRFGCSPYQHAPASDPLVHVDKSCTAALCPLCFHAKLPAKLAFVPGPWASSHAIVVLRPWKWSSCYSVPHLPHDFALKSMPFLLCQVMANDGWGDSIKIPSILVSRCELNTLCWKYWFLSMFAKEYIPDSKQSQQMNSNTSPFSNPLTFCFWLYRFAPWQTWPVRFDGEKLIESSRQQTVMVSSWV